ncbi:MAG: hypothetical protein HC859_09670 [Bacteroidia bacterium]|nr:hypothetical protein [Bacteroidia bacterium]
MRLFLQINLVDWKTDGYDKPMLRYASSLADDIIGTDLDASSEAHVVNMVGKLMEQTKLMLVFVRASPEQPLGAANALLNLVIQHREKVFKAILSGSHPMAAKMLAVLDDVVVIANDDEDTKQIVREFAAAARDRGAASLRRGAHALSRGERICRWQRSLGVQGCGVQGRRTAGAGLEPAVCNAYAYTAQ